jgi:hypothetical protein
MAVYYKFKSAKDYDTVVFDASAISVADLKNAIIEQKKLGKTADFDLAITNAQTNQGMLTAHRHVTVSHSRKRLYRRQSVNSEEHVRHRSPNPSTILCHKASVCD